MKKPRFRFIHSERRAAIFGVSLMPILLVGLLIFQSCQRGRHESALGNDPEKVLDHFLCYAISDSDKQFAGPNGLSLRDQFSDNPLPEKVGARDYVCNAAGKAEDDKEPPLPHDRRNHLVLYGINRTKITGQIRVTNQIDPVKAQLLSLTEQRFLALPSGKKIIDDKKKPPKELPETPKDLDHFKCYQVDRKDLQTHKRNYQVTDELFSKAVADLQAAFVCNPVEKHLEGHDPVLRGHSFAHLVCYSISAVRIHATVFFVNQFEPKGIAVDVDGPDFLCVPSTKEVVEKPKMMTPPET